MEGHNGSREEGTGCVAHGSSQCAGARGWPHIRRNGRGTDVSAHQRLPPDAFAYYVALGDARSHQAVAKHYGVSKRAVSKRAKEEHWRERLSDIEQATRAKSETRAQEELEAIRTDQVLQQSDLYAAIREIATPGRMKAVTASLIKAAVQDGDVQAARLLYDRLLGRARSEALVGNELGLPESLEKASDVKQAANEILKAVAQGKMSPEDGQKSVAIIEAARKAVETEELEQRIAKLEEHSKRGIRP